MVNGPIVVVALVLAATLASPSVFTAGEHRSASRARETDAGGLPAEPVTWSDVAASYERVHDYTCLYEKEERAIENGAKQTIRLSYRKPLDVRMEWINEKGKVDQIVVYRQGFNDGKLLARRSGLLGGMVGTVKLDPHDRLALEDSRHAITEAGIGHIVGHARREMSAGQINSRFVGDDTLDGQPAYKFELEAAAAQGPLLGLQDAHRGVVWIDRELKLPVRVEMFDESGTRLERHRFKSLRLNVGLTDTTFTL